MKSFCGRSNRRDKLEQNYIFVQAILFHFWCKAFFLHHMITFTGKLFFYSFSFWISNFPQQYFFLWDLSRPDFIEYLYWIISTIRLFHLLLIKGINVWFWYIIFWFFWSFWLSTSWWTVKTVNFPDCVQFFGPFDLPSCWTEV